MAGSFVTDGWCRGHDATTKGLTGFMSPHDGEAGEVHLWTDDGMFC